MSTNRSPQSNRPLDTLNECLREKAMTYPAHSNGKPGASTGWSRLSVWFAPASPTMFEIKITQSPKQPVSPQMVVPGWLLTEAIVSSPTCGDIRGIVVDDEHTK